MAGRRPGVRAKNGYWYSEAGGKGRYFGRCDDVSRAEAMSRLWRSLAEGESVDGRVGIERGSGGVDGSQAELRASEVWVDTQDRMTSSSTLVRSHGANAGLRPPTPVPSTPTVDALADRYLDWVRCHRSPRLLDESRRHLRRFRKQFGLMNVLATNGAHLEAFTDALAGEGYAPVYVKKHATTVRTLFNRGMKAGWLPQGFRPFSGVEGIRIAPRTLLETDLPTDAEVRALKASADGLMTDIISLFHATGARTHELIEAKVSDFQRNARTIVLGKHKRSRTMRDHIPRTITLNTVAYEILERRCSNRNPDDIIVINRNGSQYDSRDIAQRFATVRRRAKVRENITIYSFRHLWISEMLMAGVDVLLVARMAGTSVAMVERVYGHFRNQSYQDAQAKLDRERATRGL